MGRLATKLVSISSLTHAWANSSHLGQRRRSVAVLGAMREHTPAIRDLLWKVIGGETDPWSKATLGAALVDLVTSHRELWERIGRELLTTKASPEVICSMAEGLMTIHRRDGSLGKLEAAVVELARDRARGARGKNVADVQLWDSLLRDTDVYCGIDADANDLERTHDRLVSLALRQGAEHVALRAAGWPSTSCRIMQTVVELLPDVSDIRGRAAGLNLVESCARAVALRLWEPLLASVSHRPRGSESPEPTWDSVAAVQPWLQSEELDFALQRTALRVIALCVDATDLPSRHEQISARGQRAASVVRSLSHLPWLERGGKRAEARFRKAISDLLWRTMDATRRSASVPMPWAFQRFAAWWALSGGDPIVLRLLARSDPSVTNDLDDVILVIQDFQAALREAEKNPEDPSWLTKATTALERLHADDTDIASTLVFAQATFAGTGQSPPVPSAQSLRDRIEALAAIRRALWFDVNDPVQALALPNNPVRVSTDPLVDEAFLVYSDSTVDIDAVCDHWVRELGDCVAPIVKTALARVLRTHQATESLPPTARANTRSIGRYEVVEELGRSGMGVVYLVRDSATHRLFVLKQPCDPHGSPQPSQQLCDALEQEANVLRFINHVNVVGYKDEGRHEGLPFLVMDYLIGVDLEHYIQASPLTLRELKPIVADVCRGLSQLHAQNVVHSDLKPGNIFLRLDVAATDPANHPAGIAGVYEPFRFDNTLHREPSRCEVALSVLIDFGATFVREVYEMAGDPTKGRPCTPDYMAPECVDPTKPLEATSDVYSLAATVWAAMTGQGPFDHCKTLLEIMREQQTEAFCRRPRPPELSEELHVLLCRAMRYDPSLRVSLPAFAQYFKALK